MNILAALMSVAVTACMATAQASTMQVVKPPNSRLSLSLATTSTFDKTFAHADLGPLRPYSVILSNTSGKSIFGVTIRWTLTDATGHQHTIDYSSDSYFLIYTPVCPAGQRLLLTPSFLLPERLADSGFVSVGAPPSRIIPQFDASASVSVAIDVVIFQDGEVIGPDTTHMVRQIKSRRDAAQSIGELIRSMIQRGQDPSLKLSELTKMRASSPDDLFAIWTNRISRMLQHSRNLDQEANALLEVPQPTFYRSE